MLEFCLFSFFYTSGTGKNNDEQVHVRAFHLETIHVHFGEINTLR